MMQHKHVWSALCRHTYILMIPFVVLYLNIQCRVYPRDSCKHMCPTSISSERAPTRFTTGWAPAMLLIVEGQCHTQMRGLGGSRSRKSPQSLIRAIPQLLTTERPS